MNRGLRLKRRDFENSAKRPFEAIRSPFDALEPHARTADSIFADTVMQRKYYELAIVSSNDAIGRAISDAWYRAPPTYIRVT